ncbi:trypsin-like serine peptidase [Nonomuraea sp. NPDC050022]|uniref:trypsin-like serine peptidase n=1 Tax=Nonomuraea sp. NPDC050022 TaxID=3364358 RepID=UPI00378A7517
MKRILLPAGGAILATGLLAAGLAGTAAANASGDVASDALAKTQAQAEETLEFWTKSNNAALTQAVAFNPDSLEVEKISRGGGYSADTKPGSSVPIGEEKKVAVKSQNVNMPKTIGKVFFEGRDGKLYYCSGTSVQSQYRNLVATAGHCVYDIAGNDEVVSRWVFVPGYYQGKTPYGVYVGKQAFTHYDFDVYEDFDRDYAFATVYNGIGGALHQPTKVDIATYKNYTGEKFTKDVEVSREEYRKGRLDPKTADYYSRVRGSKAEATGPDFPGAEVTKVEVPGSVYQGAKTGPGNGNKFGEPVVENVTYNDAVKYILGQKPSWKPGDALPAPTEEFPATVALDERTNSTLTHYYVQQWFKPGTDRKYIRTDFYTVASALKDVGRLGDNVGGQGVAWNQAPGKVVRTFGYPFGPNPDGSKPYTGVTPKWCYGKTASKVVKIPARKVEEQQSLKCAVTAGYDGGPWLANYSNAKRLGYVTGVTSLIVDLDGNKRYDTITSPIFDGETAAIYKAAAASWSGKLVK